MENVKYVLYIIVNYCLKIKMAMAYRLNIVSSTSRPQRSISMCHCRDEASGCNVTTTQH